jgi:hypothetical protein
MANFIEKIDEKWLIAITFVAMALIAIFTSYLGGNDTPEYAGSSKFFAGDYMAKIRSSHSLLYSFIYSPLIIIFKSFLAMKLVNLILLYLIVLSVYYISGKNRKTLLLALASPLIWYLSPWAGPLQLASLLFLWGFSFLVRYRKTQQVNLIIYSGVLFGLAWAVWNTVIFIIPFLVLFMLFRERLNRIILFLIAILIGLLPLFILDFYLFGFPFYSIIRHLIANLVAVIYGGIYSEGMISNGILDYIAFILMIPIFSYKLFSKEFLKLRKSELLFLTVTILFLFLNPQIRYLIIVYPILIIYLARVLNEREFKIQMVVFMILSLLVVLPYVAQVNYSTNANDFDGAIRNIGHWEFNSDSYNELITTNLNAISEDYKSQVFVVGNLPDDYVSLALIYWGMDIKEFVSIQDYNLYIKNKTSIFEKKMTISPRIQDRREIWFAGGIEKSSNDKTDYGAIEYGLSVDEPINLDGFEVVKKYGLLYLSKKTN